MEAITKIPGLQYISEDVFKLLDTKSLMDCRLVNNSWKEILDCPSFCLKTFRSSDAIIQNWKSLAEQLDDDQISQEFVLVLTKMAKNKPESPPCPRIFLATFFFPRAGSP